MICDAVLVPDASSEASMVSDSIEKFIYEQYISDFAGQVDQLEDRYLGMVEAASSNLALSTIFLHPDFRFMDIFTVHHLRPRSSWRSRRPWSSSSCRSEPVKCPKGLLWKHDLCLLPLRDPGHVAVQLLSILGTDNHSSGSDQRNETL